MVKSLFIEHPASVRETYFKHLGNALCFSGRLTAAAFTAFIHAFLPFMFEKTASNIIEELHHKMVTHRVCEKNIDKCVDPDTKA